MSSTTETRTLVDAIVDNADERELWITGRLFEHAPYFHAGKGGDTRLAEALRMCLDDKITPQSDGSYQVQGSGGRVYRVAESCSCPASQHAKSRWCKHAVGVAVYVEWQRRIHPAQPVALGTLRAGTLPLPPVTVEERLALGTIHDNTALQTHHTPQEDRMPDNEYLPEPDDQNAPVTVLDASDADFPPMGQPATRPLPGPVLLPALDARTLEQSMQAWAAQRQVVKRFIQTQLVEGTDYYSLKIGQRETKPTLSKAGSEKFLGLFQLRASFSQDDATWTMLGKPEGTLCYVCTLHTRSGEIVSEGRGARRVAQDGDVNKAVKMAQKSATIDAVLRTGALSEAFTQDIGEPDEPPEPVKAQAQAQAQAPYADGTSREMRQRIWQRVQEVAPEATTREAVTRVIMERTGLALHPDHYKEIIEQLTTREG